MQDLTPEGWLTDAQADRLAAAAARLGAGARVVEIGSFRGRSTIVLARAAPRDAEGVAVDPHLGSDRGAQELARQRDLRGAALKAFRANLATAGVLERVRHVRERSQDALGAVDGPVDLLYVDGAHRYGPARDDLVRWGARVRAGGTLLVHDSFSSIGVTLALVRGVVFAGGWRYRGRVGSPAEYARVPVRGRARVANALRQLGELPWFARNVVVKALILARVRRGPWPY